VKEKPAGNASEKGQFLAAPRRESFWKGKAIIASSAYGFREL
jgi:hypothetical protein